MRKTIKRLFALLLVLTMVLSLLPTIAFAKAAENEINEPQQEELQAMPTGATDDLWEAITALEDEKIVNVRGKNATSEDYAMLVDQIIKMVEASDTFREGSIERHGDFFYWVSTDGQVNGYSPRLRAEVQATGDPEADPEAYADIETVSFSKGGTTTSKNVAVFQPYYGIDSSFTTQYADEGTSIAQATGGSSTTYKTTNATITNIGSALDTCGVVIFDSHGDTDYASGTDYTSRANTSYLCLQSNTGLTTADQAQATGTYGTYYHAYYAGANGSMKYYCVDGTAISNHMTGTSPNNLLWMAICLGMATDGMHAPIRAKGVEVTYGYSQSVSFTGDYKYEDYFFDYMKDGKTVAQAASYMKSKFANMDTYTSPNAYPIFVSSEDTYPGHGNVDAVQSVYSTWVLLGGETYTVSATSNNTAWGTVSVNGNTITASPATGYYAQGYTVVSGTATVTQNGNIFSVNPSSDCTIRINFAAKTAATVNYLANGSSVGTVSAYVGDEITLRTTATDYDGWTFKGWVENTVAETTTKPTFYNPGAAYTISNANTTLHALYTRFEEGSGGVVYELAEGLENGGTYIIVAQESISGTTAKAAGNTAVSNSQYLTPVSVTINSDDTATATSSNLPKVLWQAASSGSGYTLYNAAVGKYMGLDSSEYLYPSSTSVAWVYTSEGYLDNKIDSEGFYYLSYSTADTSNNKPERYTTSKQGAAINLYKQTNAGTTYYSTSPVTVVHEHTMEYVAAVAPTCTVAGHTAYYHCTSCNKYFSDANGDNEITQASTVIAALGHDYVATVTPPTETQQGYTTYTCSRCGNTYVDDYVPALGSDFTVHFSVPAGVTKPADMVSNTNTGITLPTVTGPEGYSFLGWVTEDYDNVETRPATILTGNYIAPQEITLKALFTYTEGSGGIAYELLTSAPSNWAGNYVITNNASTTYVLKGVNGSASGTDAESASNCSTLAASGITLDGTTMTNVANDYIITLTANGSYYTVKSAGTGCYYGMSSSSYLYAYSSINSSYCNWTPAINANGLVQLKNAANGSYPYFSWSTSNNYFWSGSSSNANVLKLYKETQVGTAYYTTIIGEEHVHTPGSPVTENVVEATCTAAGSYDTVVYCTECGEELSRETTTVPALGHNPQAAVVENNQEPSCTVAGGYDNVVYCGRCNAELSREHVEVTALGHLPGEAVRENYVEPTATAEGGYDMVVYCQRCNAELSREHTVLPATGPVDPIELTSLRVFRNVSIGTDMLITFSILESNLTDYDSWYIQVTKDGLEGTETYRFGPEACSLANGTYAVDFTHISAKEMGVMYHAQVFAMKDGVAYCGPVREGTMKQYLASTLTSTDSSVSATLKTLAADMLNYGAAAQVFLDYDTEHLVNVELSETELTALHNYETTGEASATKTNTNTVPTGEPRLLYTSVAMTNRVELGLFVNLNNLSGWQDAESIEVQMKDHETQQVVAVLPTVLNANGTQMDASFPGIGAKNMRTEYDFVTLVDGVERGNIRTWSIEGYVNQLRNDNSSSDALKALANAVLIYGDSAQRYLDAQ